MQPLFTDDVKNASPFQRLTRMGVEYFPHYFAKCPAKARKKAEFLRVNLPKCAAIISQKVLEPMRALVVAALEHGRCLAQEIIPAGDSLGPFGDRVCPSAGYPTDPGLDPVKRGVIAVAGSEIFDLVDELQKHGFPSKMVDFVLG